jgi:hypothetical protein
VALNVWLYKAPTVAGGRDGGEIVNGALTTIVGFIVTDCCGDEVSVARTVI